jgi:hypothetical protein
MDIGEFQDLVDRLGEDLSQWPEPCRKPALDLLAVSAEAGTALEQARVLRQALAQPPLRAPAGLAGRIFAAASRLNPAPAPDAEPVAASPADVDQLG